MKDSDTTAVRSRRAILASAVGGLATMVAFGLGRPATVAAVDPNDVVLGGDNVTNAGVTKITNTQPSQNSFHAVHGGTSIAVLGESASGKGVYGVAQAGVGVSGESHTLVGVVGYGTTTDPDLDATATNIGVMGVAGDGSALPSAITRTGVFGHSSSSSASTGVWGDSPGGIGVAATGDWGAYATGNVGVVADVTAGATGLYAYNGDAAPPAPPAGRAIYARAASTSQIALETSGRIKFTGRSGRTSFSASTSTKKIAMSGVTSSSWAIATLQTNRAGIHVQSVVCTTGFITINLNKAVSSTTYVGYLVMG